MWHFKARHCVVLSCFKVLKLFIEQWLCRNVFYCLDACNIKKRSSCLPLVFCFFLTTKDVNSFKLKSKASSCPWGFSPIALSLTTPHTHVHVARSAARKWVSRSYGCHPQRHVYQLWAWKRLSDNTSWTLQRSLMKFSQGHVSKAHSSSPLTQST